MKNASTVSVTNRIICDGIIIKMCVLEENSATVFFRIIVCENTVITCSDHKVGTSTRAIGVIVDIGEDKAVYNIAIITVAINASTHACA